MKNIPNNTTSRPNVPCKRHFIHIFLQSLSTRWSYCLFTLYFNIQKGNAYGIMIEFNFYALTDKMQNFVIIVTKAKLDNLRCSQ